MNRICWWLVGRLSRGLEPGERDAVLGDIAESGETGAEALRDLLSLAVRRQAALWKDARAWLALGGLIAPVAMLAGGWSSWGSWLGFVSRQLGTVFNLGVLAESAMTRTDDIVRLVCGILLMMSWAGTAGFALGSALRRSAWAYAAFVSLLWWLWIGPPLRLMFRVPLRWTLFWLLILMPFLWGVHRGVRLGSPGVGRMALLAGAIATLTLILQVEDSRATVARELWSNGGSLGWRLVWTPQMPPFLAILWQFGILTVAKEKNI
jgi:hypothetical protein